MKRGYGSNNAILWEEVTDNKESGNSITQYNSFFMIFLFIDFFYGGTAQKMQTCGNN